MLKVGDRVRFIRESGGGIVRSRKGKIIYVEGEDGFEIPFDEKDLVLVEDNASFMPAYKTPKQQREEADAVEIKEAIKIENTRSQRTLDDNAKSGIFIKNKDKANIFLAFVPDNESNLSQSRFDTYIINDSNYHIAYVYSFRDYDNLSKWHLLSEGLIESNQKLFIEDLSHSMIGDMPKISLQFMAFSPQDPFEKIEPMSVELKLDAKKFLKSGLFEKNDFFDEKAMIIELVKDNIPIKENTIKNIDFNQPKVAEKKEIRTEARLKDDDILVVDLHIEELIDNTLNLSAKDMLDKQMEHFHTIIAKYKDKEGKQIVFIHGKGEGVLRASIERELKHKYRFIDFQDASFMEYGYGATMITIRKKNFDNRNKKWR